MPFIPADGAPRPGRGAGAAALRARIEAQGFAGFLGPEAYRAYMRSLRKKAPEDLPAMGGRAVHQALLRQLGEDGYRERQRAGFDAACAKHGRGVIVGHIRRAHTERRRWRLDHPTSAEAALLRTLADLGFTVHPSTFADGEGGFDYHLWQLGGSPVLRYRDLIREAPVGPYFIDVLLPTRGIAIEVDGGVHKLRPDHDAIRRRRLERMGITLHSFTNEEAEAGLGNALARLLLPADLWK